MISKFAARPRFFSIAALGLLMAACTVGSVAAATPVALARALAPDMLGADLAYFEYGIGPPRNTYGDKRIYPIAGCEVTVTVAKGVVQSLTVDIAPPCALDVDAFLPNFAARLPPLSQLTFGDFEKATGPEGRFYADCLLDCGNAYDPSVYYHWEGPRSDGFHEVMLHFPQTAPANIEAANRWQAEMVTAFGQAWVAEGRFNCKRFVEEGAAREAFRALKPVSITIGLEIKVPACAE